MTTLASPTQRWARRIAVGAAVTTILAGAYAFKTVFARPGEDALRLIPADALVAGSMDMTPGPSQALVFKRLEDALSRNKMDNFLDKSLLDIFEQGNPGIDPMRQYVRRGGSGAMLESEDGKEKAGVALLGITDPNAVAAALKSAGKPEWWKGTQFYRLPKGRMGMMVVADTLVISPTPWALHEIGQVASGDRKSITSIPEFQSARAREVTDANLAIFVNPKLFTDKDMPKGMESMISEWSSLSVAVRDGGLELGMSGKRELKDEASKIAASAAPIRSDLYNVLPTGAYGVFAVSQPSKYFDAFESTVKDEHMKDGLSKFDSEMLRETGMSLHDDVLPAFRGDAVIGIYPNAGDSPSGVDLLLVLDDSNNANASGAVDKLVAYIDKKAHEGNNPQHPDWQTKLDIPGAQAWRLSNGVQDDMRKSMFNGDSGPIKKDTLIGDKTVAWAVVGKSVVVASSRSLLERAMGAYQSHTAPLSSDASYTDPGSSVSDSQSLMVFNFSRIAKGIENTMNLDKMKAEDAGMFKNVLGMFDDLKQNLYMKGHTGADGTFSATIFVPVDVDKTLDFVGQQMNKK